MTSLIAALSIGALQSRSVLFRPLQLYSALFSFVQLGKVPDLPKFELSEMLIFLSSPTGSLRQSLMSFCVPLDRTLMIGLLLWEPIGRFRSIGAFQSRISENLIVMSTTMYLS